MARHVRKDDLVQVISGKEKGRQGRVLRVLPDDDKVIVQNVNVRRRAVRPNPKNPQGGYVEKEQPIHLSKVLPVVDGKPTRVRFETREDGSKARVAVKGGAQIGELLRQPRKK